MGFRLVQKSVTLNDLEQRNGRYLAFFTEFDRLGGPILVELDLYSLRQTRIVQRI